MGHFLTHLARIRVGERRSRSAGRRRNLTGTDIGTERRAPTRGDGDADEAREKRPMGLGP